MSPGQDTAVRRPALVLAVCCMSLLIVSIDVTALNVALPAIGRDLGASVSGLQWVLDAYTLVLASLLMLAGSTADRIGRRRVFRTGLVLFVLGSLACSLAPSLNWLVAARVLQAVGGSMLNPVAMSIITNTFTDPRERARAIGVWGGVVGLSMAAGPMLGGLLVDISGWQAIFWLNLPIGLAALLLTGRYVPESRAEHARRPDPVGQTLMTVLLGALTYGIIEGPHHGYTSPLVLGCAALVVLAVAGIALYEPRRAEPLIDLRFFRSVPFTGATTVAVCAFAALGGFLFLTTLHLQEERGLSAVSTGLHMLPMAVLTLVCGPLSGRLVGARGPRPSLVTAGIALTATGVLFGLKASAALPLPVLFAGYVAFGIGFGFVNAPITNTAVSGMPRAQAGVAAGLASTSRQIGTSLGVAVIGAVMASAAGGRGGGAALESAGRTGWWIIGGCGFAVLVLGALSTGRRARATAERTARHLGDDAERTAPGAASRRNGARSEAARR